MLQVDSGVGQVRRAALPPGAVRALESAGAILVSDYGRGLTGLPAIQQALLSRMDLVPVIWDPHPRGSAPVAGCTLVTPNVAEARQYSGADHPAEQGHRRRANWHVRSVAVTVGHRGAVLTETEPPRTTHVPVRESAQEGQGRIDTCGAGDQFAVAATAALLEGANTRDAVQAAVVSATQYVFDRGASAVSTVSASDAIDLALGVADLIATGIRATQASRDRTGARRCTRCSAGLGCSSSKGFQPTPRRYVWPCRPSRRPLRMR